FLANGTRADNIAKLRVLLSVAPRIQEPESSQAPAPDQACALPHPCPCCGGRMFIIEFFEPGCEPTHRPGSPTPVVRIDTSCWRAEHTTDPTLPCATAGGRP